MVVMVSLMAADSWPAGGITNITFVSPALSPSLPLSVSPSSFYTASAVLAHSIKESPQSISLILSHPTPSYSLCASVCMHV